MAVVYNFIFIVFAVIYFPFLILRGKWHNGFWMRFGLFEPCSLGLSAKKRIWIHAVSVGEVLAVKNLLAKIRTRYPEYQIVLSTVTPTGFNVAHSVIAKDDIIVYAPVDLSFVVRKYIRAIQPVLFINAETEIWPNLLSELHRHSIAIVQVNGRISDKSFRRYRALKILFAPVIGCMDRLCLQTKLDADRMISLGIDPAKVHVTGNMKFDDVLSVNTASPADQLKNPQILTLIAASTHPGEEEIILDIFADIQKKFSNLRLILVPRHPERALNIERLCHRKDFSTVRFSQGVPASTEAHAVLIVDTIGQLRLLYRVADIVFVGKSLVGKGGQNMIEPALCAKPIIVGPFTGNFQDVVRILKDREALIEIQDKSELKAAIVRLLEDASLRASLGQRAQAAIEQNKGATEKTFSIISEMVGAA